MAVLAIRDIIWASRNGDSGEEVSEKSARTAIEEANSASIYFFSRLRGGVNSGEFVRSTKISPASKQLLLAVVAQERREEEEWQRLL